MPTKRQLKLGTVIHGPGWTRSAWRHPQAPADAASSFAFYKRQAQTAESGKLDLVFIVDSIYIDANSAPHMLNRLEPLTLLSALASVTSHIGLVGTLSSSYNEPYNVARQFASMDLISGGRAGWNLVTTALEGAAANYSRTEHYQHALRYRMAQEHLSVVRGLWDSWEDDAFVYDKARNVFFDPRKLHVLDHRGEFYSVKGPLSVSRSRQGHPVIFQAGASGDGRDFAARNADAVFTRHETLEEAQAFYTDIRERAARAGRSQDSLVILPLIGPIVGRTHAEAERKYEELAGSVTIEDALSNLGYAFSSYDFKGHSLDEPFPDLGGRGSNSFSSDVERITRIAREEQLTLRQTALRFASFNKRHFQGQPLFLGTAEEVADQVQHWFDAGAGDGFMIVNTLPDGLTDFVDAVVPILQRRGLFREQYHHGTLREHLGLRIPANRYASAS